MKRLAFRNLAIDLLDDEQGINKTAWKTLAEMLDDAGSDDIVRAIKAKAGRFYLLSGAAAELREVDGEEIDDDDEDEGNDFDDDDEDDE